MPDKWGTYDSKTNVDVIDGVLQVYNIATVGTATGNWEVTDGDTNVKVFNEGLQVNGD